jgi:hypothetical protein
MTWVEYKAQMERDEAARKLEPFAGEPKKRRAVTGMPPQASGTQMEAWAP